MAIRPFNWECPFCGRPQIVNEDTFHLSEVIVVTTSKHKWQAIRVRSIACAGPDCMELALWAEMRPILNGGASPRRYAMQPIETWNLRPTSAAKPQPDYIPEPLRTDYVEACQIRDLSPKASATLARRCLQGMIRDFCGIKRGRLIDEIKELESRVKAGNAPAGVTADTLDALTAVRELGNIGAHMEKDIDLIIDIDPNEAQTLIGLLELLFKDWYVAKKDREDRLAKLLAVSGAKKAERMALPSPPPALPPPDDTTT